MMQMSGSDELVARLTMRLAGVLQSTRDLWVKRVSEYFSQLESLVNGQWFEREDLPGLIRESKSAAKEALEGLSNDLSSQMLHMLSATVQRFESENTELAERIESLTESLSLALSGDENDVRRENENLRNALMTVPKFQLLLHIQKSSVLTYDELSRLSGMTKGKIRSYVKALVADGYVLVNKNTKPHTLIFVSAPWRMPESSPQMFLESHSLAVRPE